MAPPSWSDQPGYYEVRGIEYKHRGETQREVGRAVPASRGPIAASCGSPGRLALLRVEFQATDLSVSGSMEFAGTPSAELKGVELGRPHAKVQAHGLAGEAGHVAPSAPRDGLSEVVGADFIAFSERETPDGFAGFVP